MRLLAQMIGHVPIKPAHWTSVGRSPTEINFSNLNQMINLINYYIAPNNLLTADCLEICSCGT